MQSVGFGQVNLTSWASMRSATSGAAGRRARRAERAQSRVAVKEGLKARQGVGSESHSLASSVRSSRASAMVCRLARGRETPVGPQVVAGGIQQVKHCQKSILLLENRRARQEQNT